MIKKTVVTCLAALLWGGVVYSTYSLKNIISDKDLEIIKLQQGSDIKDSNIRDLNEQIQHQLEEIKKLQEDMEAIKSELETKGAKLEQYEAILSSSVIPITLNELDLFFRLVEAEAGNEDMTGKIAVANVVINRVRDSRFPDTVRDVICQPYQFQPVLNGYINKTASADSKEAVLRALKGEQVVSSDTISFWANYLDSSHALWRLPITYRLGVHVFTNAY